MSIDTTIDTATTTAAPFDLEAALDSALARVQEQERQQAEARESANRQRVENAITTCRERVEEVLSTEIRDALRITYDYDTKFDFVRAILHVNDAQCELWPNGNNWVFRLPNGGGEQWYHGVAPSLVNFIFERIAEWRAARQAVAAIVAKNAKPEVQQQEEIKPREMAVLLDGVHVELSMTPNGYGDFAQRTVFIDSRGAVTFHDISTNEMSADGETVGRVDRFHLSQKEVDAFLVAYAKARSKQMQREAEQPIDDLPF